MKTLLRKGDLYHNLDSLFKFIGKANKSDVILEGDVVKALIDSGAQISSISKSFAQKLSLKFHSLHIILDLEAIRGSDVLYMGYIEVHIKIS